MKPAPIKQNTVLLINLAARQAAAIAADIGKECRHQGIAVDVVHMVKPGQLRDILQGIRDQRPARVIVGGGDGTISAAAKTFAGTDTRIGVLPLGTTNNFARNLQLPLQWPAALAVVAAGNIKRIPLGEVNGTRFCNVATIGPSVDIARQVSPGSKRLFGRLAYILRALPVLIRYRPFRCSIHTEQQQQTFFTHEVIVANGPYHAGLPVAFEKLMQQPYLSIIVNDQAGSRWRALLNFGRLLLKRYDQASDIFQMQSSNAVIETFPRKFIEADGERVGTTPARFRVTKPLLSVFVPGE